MIDRKCIEMIQWRGLFVKVDKVFSLEFDDLEELLSVEYIEQLYNIVFFYNVVSEC